MRDLGTIYSIMQKPRLLANGGVFRAEKPFALKIKCLS